jgi:hypothetical protein
MAQHELQAAPLKVCAKLFSIPLRHLRTASAAGEIRTYCTGGRVSVALLSDIRAWLVTHPAPTRPKQFASKDHAAE